MAGAGQALSAREIEQILAAWEVSGKIAAASVVVQIDAARKWMSARWPEAKAHWEIPVEACLDNGQVVKGRSSCCSKRRQAGC